VDSEQQFREATDEARAQMLRLAADIRAMDAAKRPRHCWLRFRRHRWVKTQVKLHAGGVAIEHWDCVACGWVAVKVRADDGTKAW